LKDLEVVVVLVVVVLVVGAAEAGLVELAVTEADGGADENLDTIGLLEFVGTIVISGAEAHAI
jgi:hypothetical protein